jgi:hypothetical protein
MTLFWGVAFVADKLSRRRIRLSDEERAAIRAERTAEIKKWLQEQVAFSQAIELLKGEDENLVPHFEEWYYSCEGYDAELWRYDTGPESWANLAGEWGFALVRNGEVVDFEMVAMN